MKHGVYVDFYLKLRWPHQSGSGSKIKKRAQDVVTI